MTTGTTPSVFRSSSLYPQAGRPVDQRRKHGGGSLMEEDISSPSFDHTNSSGAYDYNYEHVLRYNQITPTYAPFLRVPERLYPAPHNCGWTFTGSSVHEKAEYYEKYSQYGKILLNFYYTSGTIKVVLMHHSEGEMQLYKKGRSLLPDIYRNVLEDPIANTDVRFRRRGTQAIQL